MPEINVRGSENVNVGPINNIGNTLVNQEINTRARKWFISKFIGFILATIGLIGALVTIYQFLNS